MLLQASKRASSYFRRCTSGWSGLISSIGLLSGAFWPAALSMRSRLPDSSFSSATRQAGDSVRRNVMRTSLAFSLRALFLFLLVFQLAQIQTALGHRHQFLLFEVG